MEMKKIPFGETPEIPTVLMTEHLRYHKLPADCLLISCNVGFNPNSSIINEAVSAIERKSKIEIEKLILSNAERLGVSPEEIRKNYHPVYTYDDEIENDMNGRFSVKCVIKLKHNSEL